MKILLELFKDAWTRVFLILGFISTIASLFLPEEFPLSIRYLLYLVSAVFIYSILHKLVVVAEERNTEIVKNNKNDKGILYARENIYQLSIELAKNHINAWKNKFLSNLKQQILMKELNIDNIPIIEVRLVSDKLTFIIATGNSSGLKREMELNLISIENGIKREVGVLKVTNVQEKMSTSQIIKIIDQSFFLSTQAQCKASGIPQKPTNLIAEVNIRDSMKEISVTGLKNMQNIISDDFEDYERKDCQEE